jgi:predicted TIM-barrel fold metal-dependent hydrolase
MRRRLASIAVALTGLTGACRRTPVTETPPITAAAPATAPTANVTATNIVTPSPAPARKFRRIDVHTHIGPDGIARALRLMDEWGIDGVVNLSGMYPGPKHMLDIQLAAAAEAKGRVIVFTMPNFKLVATDPQYGKTMAAMLDEAKRLGARGLKITKGLGLGVLAPGSSRLLAVDDHGLDPLFERAGALGMPVAIHIGDPKAFWQPVTPANERWDELRVHPEWSFAGPDIPSWQMLYDAFERLVARHPKTIFIGVHFGNDPEDPDNVARMLDRHPNLYVDTAARVPEIGRHPQEKMRRLFTKYQDRILFGTDTGIGAEPEDMMYGSTGADPPTRADEVRFFTSTWRYFETADRQFESPTPIQGRWKIDGIGLPDTVLRKIYFENAARLLRWRPPGT